MKQLILTAVTILSFFTPLYGDIVSTPLGNRLRQIFPELKNNYIDLNQNGNLDRLEDMDEQISDFLVQDDQLQVQETLEFIKSNYRYFPVRKLESVRDALESPEGTINELIGLNYGTSISQLIEKRIAMGEYGLYLPPSARRNAMSEMSSYLEKMNDAYKREGSGAETEFSSAKNSLYTMLEKGYPLPEPLTDKEREILESTLINSLIREQSSKSSMEISLYTLGLLNSSRSIPYIMPLVSSGNYSQMSIRALGSIGNMEALDLLLAALSEGGEDAKRIEIIRALGSIGAKESLQPLLEILKEENLDDQVLKAVLNSLGEIAAAGTKDRRIAAALTDYLNSADPALRIIAVKGLSAFNDQTTVASLLSLFKKERSEEVLTSLVDRAKYIDNASVVPSLIGLLQSPQTSNDLKKSILETIGSHPDGLKGINGVLEALSSSEPDLRETAYKAAKALYNTDPAATTASLSRSAAGNIDIQFQRQAARLFSELPDQGAILTLTSMLDSPDGEVKRYATLALYRIRPAGNLRIATALNKMVSNETEPLDIRINAVRALGASGFDNQTLKVEQTLITAATMRDGKYAQLRFFALKALGEMPSLGNDTIEKIISIAARERDSSIRNEAIRTVSSKGVSNGTMLAQLETSLNSLNLKNDTQRALLLCEILGEAGSTGFLSQAKNLASIVTEESDRRRLAYAFYQSGSEEGYEYMLIMGSDAALSDFITSLAESTDRTILGRVVERLKRTESDSAILELISLLEAEILFSS